MGILDINDVTVIPKNWDELKGTNVVSGLLDKAQGYIHNLRSGHRPQKGYMWQVDVYDDKSQFRQLGFFVKSCVIPQRSMRTLDYKFMNGTLSYAGRDSTPKSLHMTFWDDEDLTIYRYLTNWMKSASQSGDGTSVPMSVYARNIKIKLRDSADQETTIIINLGMAFPIDIGEVPLDYNSSDAINVPVTFKFYSATVEDVQGNLLDTAFDIKKNGIDGFLKDDVLGRAIGEVQGVFNGI